MMLDGFDVVPAGAAFELQIQEPGRKRDELWDALMEVCGVDERGITSSRRGAYNKAVAELRRVRATPADVRARARVFRVRFPSSPLTPVNLNRHWCELREQPESLTRKVCGLCGDPVWQLGTGRMECRCEARPLRRDALDELVEVSQKLGLYDIDEEGEAD